MNQQSPYALVRAGKESKPILPGKKAGIVLGFFRVLLGKPNEGSKLGRELPRIHWISLLDYLGDRTCLVFLRLSASWPAPSAEKACSLACSWLPLQVSGGVPRASRNTCTTGP